MNAPEEIATEHWTVEPYDRDEVAMVIMSGEFHILRNINLEIEEMHAITALPELFALALAIRRGEHAGRLLQMANAALDKATRESA